jgi:two-component system competent response regulator ComA
MIHILLVDDHPSVMEGTRMILEQEGDIKVSLANCADEAIKIVATESFDVMLFDLHIAEDNGIDLAKQVLRIKPESVILIYTGFEFHNHFNLMIEAGIFGFILKTSNREQLITAVRSALRGEAVLPISLVKQLRRVTLQVSPEMETIEKPALTINNRECEMLKEIAKGKSNKEIAELVLMSQRSLEYALTGLFQKLNVKSRIEASIKARQLGFLKDSDFNP